MNKISGVYKITNKITGDFYIGSSKNIKSRWARHKSPSNRSRHPNSKLYQDMVKYGLNNFKFEIIEETDSLKKREQYYIGLLNPSYNDRWANGLDTERRKNWYDIHHDGVRDQVKDWIRSHKEEYSENRRTSYSKLCCYEGKILTLNALASRFNKMRIPHAWLEAKKYLIQE